MAWPYYRWNLCYLKALGPQGQADAVPFVRRIQALPKVRRAPDWGIREHFRVPAGRTMADSADHAPVLSSVFLCLFHRAEDLGLFVWSPIAQLLTHSHLTWGLWLCLC